MSQDEGVVPRLFERREPAMHVVARAVLEVGGAFVAAPLTGVVAFRLTEVAGATDPMRWASGTGGGVMVVALGLGALWRRGASRRFARTRLLRAAALFEVPPPALRVPLASLELEAVTPHGLVLVRSGASGWERWWRARLLPTAGPSEAEALVAEAAGWRGLDPGLAPLRLPPPLQHLLAVFAVLALLPAATVALLAAEVGWSWCGVGAWTLSLVRLVGWTLPLANRVVLRDGAVFVGDLGFTLARVRLTLAGRWLTARDLDGGPTLAQARLGPRGAERLRDLLGDQLVQEPGGRVLARRRGQLARALLWVAVGSALLALSLVLGLP